MLNVSLHLNARHRVEAHLSRPGLLVVRLGPVDIYIERERTPDLFADFSSHFGVTMTRDEESEYFGEAGYSEAHLEIPLEEEEEEDG